MLVINNKNKDLNNHINQLKKEIQSKGKSEVCSLENKANLKL